MLTLYRPCAYLGAVLRHASGPTGPRNSSRSFSPFIKSSLPGLSKSRCSRKQTKPSLSKINNSTLKMKLFKRCFAQVTLSWFCGLVRPRFKILVAIHVSIVRCQYEESSCRASVPTSPRNLESFSVHQIVDPMQDRRNHEPIILIWRQWCLTWAFRYQWASQLAFFKANTSAKKSREARMPRQRRWSNGRAIFPTVHLWLHWSWREKTEWSLPEARSAEVQRGARMPGQRRADKLVDHNHAQGHATATHTHRHVHMHTHMHAGARAHTLTHTRANARAHTHTHTHTHARTHAHTHARVRAHTHTHAVIHSCFYILCWLVHFSSFLFFPFFFWPFFNLFVCAALACLLSWKYENKLSDLHNCERSHEHVHTRRHFLLTHT